MPRPGKGAPIPFTARVEQTINDAVRFPQKVHADEFPVRMLRDVRVSPDGKSVVYSALGQLYMKAAARRPAAPADEGRRLEFFPSFSRDGQWIVYTTWTDAEMGRVRVVRPDGAAGRDVVTKPGPLRRAVVLARRPEDRVPSRRRRSDPRAVLRHDAGIYVVADGGRRAACWCATAAPSPEFDHTGTRIYFREVRNEKFTLFSVGVPAGDIALPGRDEIEHVRSDNATQFAVSPDGKWVAFEERFKTYVAPFPRTGRPVDIGPATQAYPGAARLARCRLLSALVRRQPAALLGARSGALLARCRRHVRVRSPAGAACASSARTEPEAKGIPIGFTAQERQAVGIGGAGRRARHHDGRPEARADRRHARRHRERHRRRRGQPHRRRRSVGRPCRCPPAPAASTSRARRSCRGSSTCTGISAASRAGCSRNRAGRSRPTSRSA